MKVALALGGGHRLIFGLNDTDLVSSGREKFLLFLDNSSGHRRRCAVWAAPTVDAVVDIRSPIIFIIVFVLVLWPIPLLKFVLELLVALR